MGPITPDPDKSLLDYHPLPDTSVAARLYVPPDLIRQSAIADMRRVLSAGYFHDFEVLIVLPGTMLVLPCHPGDGRKIRVGCGAVRRDAASKVDRKRKGGKVPLTRSAHPLNRIDDRKTLLHRLAPR